jgi:hypothetical protein
MSLKEHSIIPMEVLTGEQERRIRRILTKGKHA